MKVKTRDGKTVDLLPLEGNEMFNLGRQAAKTGWGQEGGALRKNGPIFRLAWHLGAEPKEGMDICFTEQEVVEAIALAEQENSKKREREELDAKMKPTGLHFIFVNPSAPQSPRFYWGIFRSWPRIESFLVAWLNVLKSEWGWLPDGFQGYKHYNSPCFFVCFTADAVRKIEIMWTGENTTFRVDYTLDEGDTRGTLTAEEQTFLRFLVQTARNIEENDGSGKAPDGYLHFRGQDMWRFLLKGIEAERIWRAWLRRGRKGPRVVKADSIFQQGPS